MWNRCALITAIAKRCEVHVTSKQQKALSKQLRGTSEAARASSLELFRVRVSKICSRMSKFRTHVKQIRTRVRKFRTRIEQIGTRMNKFRTCVEQIRTRMKQIRTRVSKFRTHESRFGTLGRPRRSRAGLPGYRKRDIALAKEPRRTREPRIGPTAHPTGPASPEQTRAHRPNSPESADRERKAANPAGTGLIRRRSGAQARASNTRLASRASPSAS